MNYLFKNTHDSATQDKATLEMYLNGMITKRTAKRMIAKNNNNVIMSDEEFNELFNLGWYQEALDHNKHAWLKKENLFQV